jgi:hypothetical protein
MAEQDLESLPLKNMQVKVAHEIFDEKMLEIEQ